jgi:hypothetical protein
MQGYMLSKPLEADAMTRVLFSKAGSRKKAG